MQIDIKQDAGVAKNNKAASNKTAKEQYLKLPYHILNILGLGLCEKVLLAHLYSFGAKGCWQSNDTLAEIFIATPRTVRRWLANIITAKLVQVKCPKGYYRTIRAKSHPDVRAAAQLYYRGRKLPGTSDSPNAASAQRVDKNGQDHGQMWPREWGKNGFRHGQKCPPANNATIRETTGETTAPPAPLPAGGQAPAVLAERRSEVAQGIEEFTNRFGLGQRRSPPLSQEEFDERRRKQKRALMAMA